MLVPDGFQPVEQVGLGPLSRLAPGGRRLGFAKTIAVEAERPSCLGCHERAGQGVASPAEDDVWGAQGVCGDGHGQGVVRLAVGRIRPVFGDRRGLRLQRGHRVASRPIGLPTIPVPQPAFWAYLS